MRRNENKLTAAGLPRNAGDWTEDDWRDLWRAIQQAIQAIAERHQEQQ